MATKNTIEWNEKQSKFQTEDKVAYLEYKVREGGKVMEITHTYVPPRKRGQDVAADLCSAAFLHALNCSMSVIPTCSYVSGTFLPRNPNWNSILYKKGGDIIVKPRL